VPVIFSQAEQEESNQITRSDQHRFARPGARRQPLAEDTVDQQLWQMLMDNRALASDPIDPEAEASSKKALAETIYVLTKLNKATKIGAWPRNLKKRLSFFITTKEADFASLHRHPV